MSRVASDSE
jgi:hypothetical protein